MSGQGKQLTAPLTLLLGLLFLLPSFLFLFFSLFPSAPGAFGGAARAVCGGEGAAGCRDQAPEEHPRRPHAASECVGPFTENIDRPCR